MTLGQSVKGIAIDKGITVQDFDYAKLKVKMDRDDQRSTWGSRSVGVRAMSLPGLVTDDAAAQTIGSWTSDALSPVGGLVLVPVA